MAITKCKDCGTTTFRRVSTDSTGTLAICTAGHYNFDPTTTDDGGIETGQITVTGQSVIGRGIVIGHIEGDYRGNE